MLEEGVGGGPPKKTVYPRFVFKNFTRRGNCGRKQLGGASGEGGGNRGLPPGLPPGSRLNAPFKKISTQIFVYNIFSEGETAVAGREGMQDARNARGCRPRGGDGG